MTAIEYAQECIRIREVQIVNIKNYIDWCNKHTEEASSAWSQIEKALEKGGFTEIDWNKGASNRMNMKILESKEILESDGFAFTMEITGKCKGYVGNGYDGDSWAKKVKPSLQKKRDKIEALLPQGYSLGCSGFYPWGFQVVNAGEVKEIHFQIYKK